MKIHIYQNVSNFGDMLNKYIWPHYFKRFTEREDDLLMFGIGTVLGHDVHHDGRIIVCGSGCGYGQKIDAIDTGKWKFFFVRGPLTAQVLKLPATAAITDPGILTPALFKAAAPNGRVAFIPHWETSLNPLWRRACIMAGLDYIDPLAPVADVAAALSSAKLVVAEAMHGAILADAYRVPWIPVFTSSRINKFKWSDWAQSLDIKMEFQHLAPLGLSDKFRNFTLDPHKQDAVHKALTGNTQEAGPPAGPKTLTGSIKSLSARMIPAQVRGKIKDDLYLKLGPKIDRIVERAIAHGYFEKVIAQTAAELAALSKKEGYLSGEAISQARHAQMLDKFADVEKYLESYPALAP